MIRISFASCCRTQTDRMVNRFDERDGLFRWVRPVMSWVFGPFMIASPRRALDGPIRQIWIVLGLDL